MTLGVKAITFMAVILLAVGAILSWYFLTKSQQSLIGELHSRAESLTNNLARSSKWALLSEDDVVLDEVVNDILREDSILYVAISNSNGEILKSKIRDGESSDPLQIAILHAEFLAKSHGDAGIHYHLIDGVGSYHTYMPVESTPELVSETDEEISNALALLGNTGQAVPGESSPQRYGNVQLLVSSKKMSDEIRSTLVTGIGLTLVIVLGALAVSYIFVSRTMRPIRAIASAAEKISAGDFSQEINVSSGDEIGVLAETFNHMSDSISRMTLAGANRLEQLAALHEAGLLINSTLDVKKVIGPTLEIVVRRLGYSRALLFLADWDKRVLTHGRVVGGNSEIDEYFRELEIPLTELGGFCARVALSGQSILVDEAARSKTGVVAADFELEVPDTFLVVPLMLKGHSLGVMAIASNKKRDIRESDGALLETLANQMAIAIANATSYQEIEELNFGLEASVRERTAELQQQQVQLEDVNRELVLATNHKSEFLANMSHELRTPLNAVIGYSELLQEEMGDQGISEFIPDLKKIHSAGRHLLALINDVLDLSKIEAGKMDIFEEESGISEIVDEVSATIGPFIESRGNQYRVSVQQGRIRTDVTKLRQILFNLLSNAAKFTESGSVTLDVQMENENGQDNWIFRVTDTGVGIAPEKMNELFEEFSQLDSDVARQQGGTGLGLAISQRFCRMLGGEITVTSEPGQGSVFTASLPAQRYIDEARAVALKSLGQESTDIDHCDVLIIDDDPAVRDLVSRYLTKEGYRVHTAATGDEGVAEARRLKPAAITLDILMPGVDGWAVLSQLKADSELADIPVIIMSILDDKDVGYTLGAADYLTKPIEQHRLASVLSQYCDKQTQSPILVIEDEADTLRLVTRVLEKEGWPIAPMQNAEFALEYMRSKPKPSLIILDLMLPGMDGFEFIEALHDHASWRGIPIVVVTAKDLTQKEHESLNRSVEMIMRKGLYNKDDLLNIVRTTMENTVVQKS